ncbi:MAG TPA: rod shape-determining protein RodA, partial [Armatimonadetes bacterium]|nr:rod shape-determining protein RodA [Armatimonadota bacterium]
TQAMGSWSYAKRQAIFMIFGIVVMVALMFFNFHHLPRFSGWLYAINIALLLLVLLAGKQIAGAQRWFRIGPISVQPSEFAKLICVITLAVMLTQHKDEITSPKFIARTALHIGIPALLVLRQPDLGTAAVIIALWLGMLWFAGAKGTHLMVIIVLGLLMFTAAWHAGLVKDYQKQRLIAFINPHADPQGFGYHIIQAQTAIGSGGLTGKGLFRGKMGRLRFIPAHHTDFIFVTIGEETGFVGSVLVVALFIALLQRLLHLMHTTENEMGVLLIGGIFWVFFTHIVINIGMTLRLMPITGLPLPFFSYGGSNLLTSCIAIGLAESVAMRRRRLAF